MIRSILLAVAAVLALSGCTVAVPGAPVAGHAVAGPVDRLVGDGMEQLLARDALAELAVKGRAPKTGYDRDEFPHWSDADGDGCDTRAEILRRDAVPGTAVTDRGGCVVGAEVDDPYTGTRIYEAPGSGSEVDIEHVVALSDAWQKGAGQWSKQRRETFANDPLNLMAVDDGQNAAHGDGDAATWLPPRREYWCDYVARQIAVKHHYELWVTTAERDAMERVLERCPGQPLPTHRDHAT